jgi:A/G-specific adenine glycosylase
MESNLSSNVLFVSKLLHWHKNENKRQMPWKGEKDPYKIWLSEIILQQTRVDQGLKYYQKFITVFPQLKDLAEAENDQVFKLWEGLGYYSRCRNLLETARNINSKKNGVFPTTYEEILSLKGIGSYTAAAIASFAFNLPFAVLDGNVYRILSRIFNDHTPIDSTEGKKLFSKRAAELLPVANAAEYNQAIMDFGALICTPAPKCGNCFYSTHCLAYKADEQNELPVKLKKNKIKERWFNYFLLFHNDSILLRQRIEKDIWQNLYEPLLVETKNHPDDTSLQQLFHQKTGTDLISNSFISITQKLSHQLVHFRFYNFQMDELTSVENYKWISKTELGLVPFPKTIQKVISSQLSAISNQ